MTEGNFVDYIKVYASSGKGGRGSATYTEKNLSPKEDQMAEMVAVEVILFFVEVKICGHYFI